MNYGEELAYWYLRLNGFFPITNFVLHRNAEMPYNSDADVLAIRPPHVFEAVGGNEWDWDPYLRDNLDFREMIGLVCEVKTGAYEEGRLFKNQQTLYALGRLGLVTTAQTEQFLPQLATAKSVSFGGNISIAKLFVSQEQCQSDRYLSRSIEQLETFLEERVQQYPAEKFGARMFFSSPLFQGLIDRVHRSIRQRNVV